MKWESYYSSSNGKLEGIIGYVPNLVLRVAYPKNDRSGFHAYHSGQLCEGVVTGDEEAAKREVVRKTVEKLRAMAAELEASLEVE